MTFVEIIESLSAHEGYNGTFDMWREGRASHVRSARRALRLLVDKGLLIEIGCGGRREPFRYCVDLESAQGHVSDEMQEALQHEGSRALNRALIVRGSGHR